MALSGAIVTDASGTGVFFGTPSQSVSGSSGYEFDVTGASYGAIGNEVTDDTAAINAAIVAAELQGGGAIVYFPGGTYGVTGLLQVASGDIRLLGDGAVIKQLADNSTNQILYIGGDDVEVETIEFDGNFPTVKGGTYNADTAQSGSSSTIQLASGASSADNTYNGSIVEILSNTGSGQWRWIRDYTGSNRTADIHPNWTTPPDNTSVYEVYNGDGHGINILADNVHIKNCKVYNTKGEGIASQTGSGVVRVTNTIVEDAGEGGMHLKADEVYVHGCRVENWNTVNAFSGIRAIECDPQECDAECVEIIDTHLKLDSDTTFTDGILIDAGDNDLTTGDSTRTPFGSSGVATEDGDDSAGAAKSYIQYSLDAGHGFHVGDSVWIDGSGETSIDGATLDGKSHVIRSIGGTGNVFARVESTTTLSLYKNAAAARTGGSTDKVTLTDGGTNTTYISATRAGRTTITSVDTGTSTITTAAAHGFITGAMVRLTQGSSSTVMPGGLVNAGTITLNTQYAAAGTGASYMRPKRVRNVTLKSVTIDWHPSDSADCNAVKINNANNVLVERLIVSTPPEYGSDVGCSLRLAQGLRKVSVVDCKLAGTLINNTLAFIPDLTITRCEIGDGETYPAAALTTMTVGRLTLTHNTLRFAATAIDIGGVDYLRDDDIIEWIITDNVFEGKPTTDARVRVFDIDDNAQLVNSRKVRYFNNERRNVGAYTGMSISSLNTTSEVITMSTYHQLQTGDLVQMVSASPPGGTTNLAWYYIRKTDNTTLKLYATKADAFADSSPINLSSAGSGSKLWSRKIGVQFSNNGNRDFLFEQKNDSGNEFIGIAAPTTSVIAHNVGDIVWAMHPSSGATPGWLCVAPGIAGSTAATFAAMANLA